MKSISAFLVFCCFLVFLSCSKDDDIVILSDDNSLSSMVLSELTPGVRIDSDNDNFVFVSRNSPEKVAIQVELPEGASISELSGGMEKISVNSFELILSKGDYSFVVLAQDGKSKKEYSFSVKIDPLDQSLHIIEQLLQNDKSYSWVHKYDSKSRCISSERVNIANDKNRLLYSHKLNSDGFITETIFKASGHQVYTYLWSYTSGVLTSYTKAVFNRYPEIFSLKLNDLNLITQISEFNNSDYLVGKREYSYDDNNRLSKLVYKKSYTRNYEYDSKDRIISDGKYSYEYDESGNISKKIRLFGSVISINTYNEKGLLLSIYSGKGEKIRGCQYFGNSTLKSEDGAYGKTIYNTDGSHKDYASYNNMIYEYDSNHCVISITSDESANSFVSIKSTFNDKGQCLTDDDSDGVYTVYSYNEKGQCIKDFLTYAENHYLHKEIERTITYKYDGNGLLVQNESTKDGEITKYEYGEYGTLLSKITINESNDIIQEKYFEFDLNAFLVSQSWTSYRNGLKHWVMVFKYNKFGTKVYSEFSNYKDGEFTGSRVQVDEGNGLVSVDKSTNSNIRAFVEKDLMPRKFLRSNIIN